MSWTTRLRTMPAGTRRLMGGGAIVAVLAGATWAIAASRDGDGRDKSSATMAGMQGMEGMAGMDMSSDGSVRLTAAQIDQFGITFGSVEERTLESGIRTVGIVNFDETRIAQVAPKFSGYVERLYVDFSGKRVRRGQPLAAIYSPELVAAQEELLLARRLESTLGESAVPGVPASSSDLLAAAKRRLKLWDISEQQIEEILRTGRVRRTLTLYAPVSGVVVEKNVVEGQAIQPGEKLYTIADLSEVWAEAELREADAGNVTEGSVATIELGAFPGRPLEGRVEYIYPTLQEEARTLKARIAVPNPEGRLKPGMFATVHLSTPTRRALTMPTSAVVHTGERSIVFVDMGGGRIMPHEVETGRTAGDYTEVLSGLEPGQRVVTSAQFLLDSESNLAEVMRSMMGQMGTADMGNMDMPGMDMKSADMKRMKMPPERR